MPAGYGAKGLPPAATTAAAGLPKPTGSQSNDLARAAIAAVPKLAAAAGHPIKAAAGSSAGSGGSGSQTLLIVILAVGAIGAALAVVAFRRRRARMR
jgi:hypothetical protein